MKKMFLSATGVIALALVSCGPTGSDGNSFSQSTSSKVEIKNLSISEEVPDNVINIGETFYIKWSVDYSGWSTYHIEFFTLPDQRVPDGGNDEGFANLNCGSGAFSDCPKGIQCTYTSQLDDLNNTTKYYLTCYYYSTLSKDWEKIKTKEIDPYTTSYIGADALVYELESGGTITEKHSKKAIPITFGF